MLFGKRCIGTVAYLGGLPALLEEFCWAWSQMVEFTCEQMKPDEYVHFDRTKASLHDVARNFLANRMRGDWLMMMDTDHSFEPDIVLRMVDRLDVCKIDVLTALYQYKAPPHSPVLYSKDGEFYRPIGSWRPAKADSGLDIFPVDGVGGGCLLVRRSVFARIKTELGEEPFDRDKLGEDLSFAKRCERLGIKLYCDARIESNHLQTRPLSMKDYDREAMQLSDERPVDAFAMKGA